MVRSFLHCSVNCFLHSGTFILCNKHLPPTVIDGHSNKSDRINSLSEMCSSFAVTIILCDLIGIFTLAGLAQMGKCPTNVIEIIAVGLLLSLVGEVSSCYLYSHYVQMRFTIVVKQFVVSNEWTVAVEK